LLGFLVDDLPRDVAGLSQGCAARARQQESQPDEWGAQRPEKPWVAIDHVPHWDEAAETDFAAKSA
jgi:hypothetical protein